MRPDSIQDASRVVIGDARYGGVIPGTRAELWRDVYLVPGADVHGPVCGNAVTALGPGVRVRESVYARGPLTVAAAEGGEGEEGVSFDGCVTTPDALHVGDVPFRTRFRSNVHAGTLRLHNAIVFGNVYARSAVIRNSVVLGGVFVGGRLTVADSVLATFRARVARLEGIVSLLFPVALSDEPMQLAGHVRALSFWALDPRRRGAMGQASGVVPLGAGDVYTITGQLGDQEMRTYHMISVDQRILDTQPMMESLRSNRQVMEGLSMLGHLRPRDAEAVGAGEAARLEEGLFELVKARDLPVATASRSLAEIAGGDVLGALRDHLSPEMARVLAAQSHALPDASPLFGRGLSAETASLFEPGPEEQQPKPGDHEAGGDGPDRRPQRPGESTLAGLDFHDLSFREGPPLRLEEDFPSPDAQLELESLDDEEAQGV